jgi:hypothetical protein
MKKYIIKITYVLAILIGLNTTIFIAPAFATGASQKVACNTLNSINPSEGCGSTGLDGVITAIVNLLSVIVGIVSVVMLVVGGLKFITSGGDANAVSSAKSTVIYALVGLLIVALAQTIVHVVLNASTGTVDTPPKHN